MIDRHASSRHHVGGAHEPGQLPFVCLLRAGSAVDVWIEISLGGRAAEFLGIARPEESRSRGLAIELPREFSRLVPCGGMREDLLGDEPPRGFAKRLVFLFDGRVAQHHVRRHALDGAHAVGVAPLEAVEDPRQVGLQHVAARGFVRGHGLRLRYRELLAQQGIDLELRTSNGSAENLARLRDHSTDVELALVRWLNLLLGKARERGMVFARFRLERDGAADLAREMERLKKSCRRLVWLNPLLRYDRFEAKAQGIRAMLPFVDEFRPIHNLASIEDLARALAGEWQSAVKNPKAWLRDAA